MPTTNATKRDLKGVEDRLNGKIEKLDKKIAGLAKKIDKSELTILTELKNLREDSDAHQFSHVRINDELQEHDTRIKSLENAKS